MANVLERGIAVWRRHWPGLFLACLAVAVVPGLTVALVGALLGLLPVSLADALVLLLPVQFAGQGADVTLFFGQKGSWVLLVLYGVLVLLGSAGILGILWTVVHEGRAPKASDFLGGIRRYAGRLVGVRVLCGLVLVAAALAAGLVYVLAGSVLAGWLVPIAGLAALLAGISAVLYADFALVVEEGTATEAMGDSVGVLTERWREAVGAALMFILISVAGEAAGWLVARIIPGLPGLLLSLLPVALAESILLAYLAVRYVEHVHRGIYGRDGRFAIDERKAG
ncbi:hypothetical protein [Symbiobacterium thermophilum]|uniref:Uncharacterized protein n=1 Tax=Symbiobacterium thermophilum (strain DSM 24528 / JCM 14929 / IAM 14863 / T) TaxID=292459 RepID=Q67KK4_SYMTH|nr:hypothetical protein [Symbiobacterium thermophilum]BAD41794.1 conserved hypothetical protein [Symbiobacterium thermophilum IAM 14863]